MSTETEQRSSAVTLTDKFFEEVKVQDTGPVVDRTDLGVGAIVRYIRTVKKDGRFGKQQLHTFHHTSGETFSVWGTKDLNDKLAELRRGAVIIVRYAGQDQESDDKTHRWQVSAFRGTMQDLANLRRQEWASREQLMRDAIEAAAERERTRRANNNSNRGGADEPPPVDDADFGGWGS